MAAGTRPVSVAADPDAEGRPDDGFPYPWSVYRWLDGVPAATAPVADLEGFTATLARFLLALAGVDATGGPEPGRHDFFRGGPLGTYEGGTASRCGSTETSRSATCSCATGGWRRVLDFGSSGVGDPACDMVIAWTFLHGRSRDRFRAELGVDRGTWSRGRGWALWKALITLVGHLERDAPEAALARRDIEQVLADHAAERPGTGARTAAAGARTAGRRAAR